jgi:anti-sigma regulatory factor (Ser/Thr protein kinase)
VIAAAGERRTTAVQTLSCKSWGAEKVQHRIRCVSSSSAPREVRREVTQALDGVDPEAVAVAQLLVSELATNVVLHGGEEMEVEVAREPDRVRIAVSDGSDRMPVRRHPDEHADSGRGLGLVETAASNWGVQPQDHGKTIWFELALVGQRAGALQT